MLNIQNPANYKHLKGAFGLLNEDSSLYEGYSRIKGMGFDGYISKPNFDTPDYKVYYNDPEYILDRKKIAELEKKAHYIDLNNISKDFVIDGNYAIHGRSYYYTVTDFFDDNNIQYNLYSFGFK